MADDDSVKLQSGDNEVFSVSKEVACQAVTIKEMLEGAIPQCPLACVSTRGRREGEGGKGEGLGGRGAPRTCPRGRALASPSRPTPPPARPACASTGLF